MCCCIDRCYTQPHENSPPSKMISYHTSKATCAFFLAMVSLGLLISAACSFFFPLMPSEYLFLVFFATSTVALLVKTGSELWSAYRWHRNSERRGVV